MYSDSLSGILLACVWVQGWRTESGARDIEFGLRRSPLHPHLDIQSSGPGVILFGSMPTASGARDMARIG